MAIPENRENVAIVDGSLKSAAPWRATMVQASRTCPDSWRLYPSCARQMKANADEATPTAPQLKHSPSVQEPIA